MSSITPASNSVEEASSLVALSMLNTPSFVEIFRGDESTRLAMSTFLFKRKIAMMLSKVPDSMNCFYAEDGTMECFFMILPDEMSNFSLCEQLSAGLYQMPFVCGLDVTQRIMTAGDKYDKVTDEVTVSYPKYLKLNHMVVNPKKQGQGVGSKHLGTALREQADKLQLPVYLDTQELKNTVFYSRLGFKIVHTVDYSFPDAPQYNYTSWCMIREPQEYTTSK